ncbi:MAG: hypothetical protein WD042_13405 [Phycisphaeraceae bacterium]
MSTSATATAFAPPSPQQVHAHLERYAATGPSKVATWAPLALLVAAVVLAVNVEGGALAILPWLILLAMFIYSGVRTARLRTLEGRAIYVQELAMLRRHVESLRLAWRLLPSVTHLVELHTRTVALIGHNLEQVQAYESALAVLDYLLARMPADSPAAVQLRVQRAIAQLESDHLLDADETLRRLRDLADSQPPTTVSALWHLGRLLQQVRTHHDQDAADSAANLVEQLRPLGVEAGYGHALAALAQHRLAQRPQQAMPAAPPEDDDEPARLDPQQRRQEAALWWSRATLLLSVDALVDRFPELGELKRDAAMVATTSRHTPKDAAPTS